MNSILRHFILAAGLLTLSTAQAASPKLRPFEPDSLARIEQTYRGRVFWLVLWDRECVYCVQSMRHLAKAQRRRPALRVITVATDSVQDGPELQAHLQRLGLKSQAYAFGDAPQEALRYAIDPSWRGEKPRAYRYDAQGGRTAFTGVLDDKALK